MHCVGVGAFDHTPEPARGEQKASGPLRPHGGSAADGGTLAQCPCNPSRGMSDAHNAHAALGHAGRRETGDQTGF
eukprot:7377698-Prymnesium_polylepis.1